MPAGAPTETLGTEAGVVLGTTAYMSPEQVRAQVVDAFGYLLLRCGPLRDAYGPEDLPRRIGGRHHERCSEGRAAGRSEDARRVGIMLGKAGSIEHTES